MVARRGRCEHRPLSAVLGDALLFMTAIDGARVETEAAQADDSRLRSVCGCSPKRNTGVDVLRVCECGREHPIWEWLSYSPSTSRPCCCERLAFVGINSTPFGTSTVCSCVLASWLLIRLFSRCAFNSLFGETYVD